MEYDQVPKRINAINELISKVNYEIGRVCMADQRTPRKHVEVMLENFRVVMAGETVLKGLTDRRQELNDELAKLESANDVLIKISEGLLK